VDLAKFDANPPPVIDMLTGATVLESSVELNPLPITAICSDVSVVLINEELNPRPDTSAPPKILALVENPRPDTLLSKEAEKLKSNWVENPLPVTENSLFGTTVITGA
jgi:hypothetical protein